MEIDADYVWCAFSPDIRGRAFLAQAAASPGACARLPLKLKPGTPVTVRSLPPARCCRRCFRCRRLHHCSRLHRFGPPALYVAQAHCPAWGAVPGNPSLTPQNSRCPVSSPPLQATVLRVTVTPSKHALDVTLGGGATDPAPGDLVVGRVQAVSGAGIIVQLSAQTAGKVRCPDRSRLLPQPHRPLGVLRREAT